MRARAKTQNANDRRQPRVIKGLFLAGVIIACLSTAALLTNKAGLGAQKQTGLLDESQTSSGEDLSDSLDLRLAKKASYPSGPILVVKELGSSDGVKRQIISFQVKADGLTEYGREYLPDQPKPASGWPVVILCHGYINPAEYITTDGYLSDMNFYARSGFAVIKPDFRGQGLSEGQGQPEGAYYSMVYNTDLLSLISAVKDTNSLNPKDLNLWGHSMGAYIALRASVVSKDVKNTILLSGPTGSLKQIYLSYVPPSDENNPLALKVRNSVFAKYGTPGENGKFWQNASPASFLGSTAVNYQIHMGLLDTVVPLQLSYDLDNDLKAINRAHEFYTYSDGRHNLLAQRDIIWARSLALLKKTQP